jgi:small subunit ribosomal protein S16
VQAILSKTGDWQKFKGLPAPTEPLKVAAARVDRTAAYEVEAKAAAGLAETETRPKREPGKKAAKAAAEPKATEPKAEPKADAGAAPTEAAPAQEPADAGTDAQA